MFHRFPESTESKQLLRNNGIGSRPAPSPAPPQRSRKQSPHHSFCWATTKTVLIFLLSWFSTMMGVWQLHPYLYYTKKEMYVCMLRTYVRMYVCMHVCMYACMYIYIFCVYIYIYILYIYIFCIYIYILYIYIFCIYIFCVYNIYIYIPIWQGLPQP